VKVSTVRAGEDVGLEEIADGIWDVYFRTLRLGRLDERPKRTQDEYGRLHRRDV
jgi:putative transposase